MPEKRNSFEELILTGANTTRYFPIFANAAGMIGAYRKVTECIVLGQVPLFLLDGNLSASVLQRAVEKLELKAFVAIYRPFDVKIKKRSIELFNKCVSSGLMKSNGTAPEWLLDDKSIVETTDDELLRRQKTGPIQRYLDYEKANAEYAAAIETLPIDAATGNEIAGDINEYLYDRAKSMFPLGVESILVENTKQSAIPKIRFFVDGLEDAPPPKGVRHHVQFGKQILMPAAAQKSVDDTVAELCDYFQQRIAQTGAVTLPEMLQYCAGIGLYKGNVTLYALGAAFRSFNQENAVFYDGVAYWRYAEVLDVSTWIMRVYDLLTPRRIKGELRCLHRKETASAVFYDNTTLKDRMEWVFSIKPTSNKRFDTLGMTIVQINKWIIENLHYPIAFLDGMLHQLLSERILYGEALQRYDQYFTRERCQWLKKRLPQADTLARWIIKDAVGFDPDTTCHPMSWLPEGHYAPVLYSVEDYIREVQREPRIAV